MTRACYRNRRIREYDENPLIAALPLKEELHRQFLASGSCQCPARQRRIASSTPVEADGRAPLRSNYRTEEAMAFLDAVHHSLIEGYRPRNPLEASASGAADPEFKSPPVTLLTWEMGDRQALALFERATAPLPTVIDLELFNGREFRLRQLVRVTLEVHSTDVVGSACMQLVHAADAAFGSSMASTISRKAARMPMARAAPTLVGSRTWACSTCACHCLCRRETPARCGSF